MPIGVRVVTIFVWSRLTSVAASLARGGGGLGESRAGNEGSRRLVRRRVKLAGILALSERQASNQRNQRESSDKHLHDTSPCYGRSSVGCCNSGEADGDRQHDALARRDPPASALRAGKGKIESVRNAPLEDGKMIGERQHRLHHMQIMQARRVSFRRHRLESESKLVSQLGERGKSLAHTDDSEIALSVAEYLARFGNNEDARSLLTIAEQSWRNTRSSSRPRSRWCGAKKTRIYERP